MAARARRELNADVDVIGGPYGKFQVLVDGVPVLDGGRLAALGVLPSSDEVVKVLREKLNTS